MAKAKTKSIDDVVVEEVTVEETVTEEVTVEKTVTEDAPHPNPIIQMAIDQARQRFLRENGN
jgi:hypothetical protein